MTINASLISFLCCILWIIGTVGSFNNWQIIFFALLTLVFCLTGAIWTVELVSKGRYKIG